MSDTGKRIKIRRKQLGINADKLADKIGCSRSTIFRYENGDIEKVPGEIINLLAETLNTTPAYLMGWEDNLNTDTDFVATLFKDTNAIEYTRKLLALNDKNKRSVYDMIDFLSNKENGD